MAGNGGYQAPNTPAAVSGPGALSQRTDGRPSGDGTQAAMYIAGQKYGENKALNDMQAAAPLAGGNNGQVTGGIPIDVDEAMFQNAAANPLTRGSDNPNSVFTEGADFGEGGDFSSLGLNSQAPVGQANVAALRQMYTGLKAAVDNGDATDSTVSMYLKVVSQLGRLDA